MKRLIAIGALGLSFIAVALTTQAQDGSQQPGTIVSPSPSVSPSATPTSAPGGVVSDDAAVTAANRQIAEGVILNYVHHINMTEMQEANLAVANSVDDQVVNYGRTLLRDHQTNDLQLFTLAANKGVAIQNFQSSTMDIERLMLMNDLAATASSNVFKRVFAMDQQQDHQLAIQDLQFMLNQVQDNDIRTFIQQTITLMQSHVQMAGALLAGQPIAVPTASPTPSPTISPTPSPTVSPSPSPSPSIL